MRPDHFIYFFSVAGFFIGLTIGIFNYEDPFDLLKYTFTSTLFFYLIVHFAIAFFIDLKKLKGFTFDKKGHEKVSEILLGDLDTKERKIEKIFASLSAEDIYITSKTNVKK